VTQQDQQAALHTSNMIKKVPAVRDIHASIVRATSGRRILVTEKGYIGLGPKCAREGDRVAILLGGSTSFVLRGINEHWKVLGNCYMHGAMDGEFVKDEDTADWPMFELI
jgi:hypothetical protein